MGNIVLNGKIHHNGQITVPKPIRDELDIKEGDILVYELIKIIANDGMIRYEKEVK